MSTSTTTDNYYHHPWPEFVNFVNWVSCSGYYNAPLDVDLFVDAHQLHDHFLKVANASLAFARDFPTLLWSLPKEDIEVVVASGSPFLFTNGSASAARMKILLCDGVHILSESDKPSTADLMEFLLSYAHMAIGYSEDMKILSRVESSVRKLFSELANSKGTSTESVATIQKKISDSYAQAPRSFGKNFEKKRGDWTCPRCSFMNFAKNLQCLQCEEHRPKKFLLGGEWECPQCNFCNFGRNVVCLRCDCKKPAVNLFLSPTSDSDWRLGIPSVKGNTKKINSVVKEEQQWFTKITELEKSSDMSSALGYEDLPETMKAGDNRFATIARNSGIVDSPFRSNLQTTDDEYDINVNISQSLEEHMGQKTSPYMSNKGDIVNKSRASNFSAMSSTASQYEQHNEPKFGLDTDAPAQQLMSKERFSSNMETKDNERGQAKKSERWLKKVTELRDVENLPNTVSDDEFPEIMPMRKGENRFVVSKKKDRSLSSPMYKRRVAMEQAGKNSYVPFVHFPPDYFAKDKPQEGSESTRSNEQTGVMSLDSGLARESKEDESCNPTSNHVNPNPKSFDSQFNSPNGYSESHSTSEKATVIDSWRERSLEGSGVKESDPLDMSEEAKAERWFQHVAQIKDISELSQIPDEDFPSVMPMRKGVNRFVVRKRKTPLERRLTSSQYRRSLPVVGSDPVK